MHRGALGSLRAPASRGPVQGGGHVFVLCVVIM